MIRKLTRPLTTGVGLWLVLAVGYAVIFTLLVPPDLGHTGYAFAFFYGAGTMMLVAWQSHKEIARYMVRKMLAERPEPPPPPPPVQFVIRVDESGQRHASFDCDATVVPAPEVVDALRLAADGLEEEYRKRTAAMN